MAFDPIFLKCLQESIIVTLEFLQPAQCAYDDDLAVAPSPVPDLMFTLAPAFRSIDCIAGLNLNYRECCWVQYGNVEHTSLRTWISENFEEFREMQIVRHATFFGIVGLHQEEICTGRDQNQCVYQKLGRATVRYQDLLEFRAEFHWLRVCSRQLPSRLRTIPFCVPLQDRTSLSPLNLSRLAPTVDLVLIWLAPILSDWSPAVGLQQHTRPHYAEESKKSVRHVGTIAILSLCSLSSLGT